MESKFPTKTLPVETALMGPDTTDSKRQTGLPKEKKKLFTRIGTGVSILLVLAALYLILMPFIPEIPFFIKQLRGETVYDPGKQHGSSPSYDYREEADPLGEIPDANTLYIPAVGINVKIVGGLTEDALNYGAWHRPGTGSPDTGGNMVITGHRFRYLPPSNLTFYHLPKLKVGDDVIVYWKGIQYDYVVTETFVVGAEQVEIEGKTVSPRITLYTCTPLWTAKQRFVVIAEPLDEDGEENGQENGFPEDGDVELQKI